MAEVGPIGAKTDGLHGRPHYTNHSVDTVFLQVWVILYVYAMCLLFVCLCACVFVNVCFLCASVNVSVCFRLCVCVCCRACLSALM